jgi:hypothetical protein
LPEKLKPQTAYSFGIGGEQKLGREMAVSTKSNYSTSMISTTNSCRFVELYEKRMRRFNLTVLSAAAVALAVASLLMLNS